MQYEWTPDELNSVLGQRLNKSQGFRPRTKSGISISVKKCKECGLLHSQPQPIPFNIQDHYGTPPENYWKKEYFEWSPNYFAYQIKEVINLIGTDPDKKALDIGAGLGKAMLSLEHYGFDAYGIEPSISFYERAISEMGVPKTKLKLGAVEEVDFPLESFDFITFGAVFEHLYDPKECLKKALSQLKPNGIIQIEVPSADWLIPKFMNLYFKMAGTNYVTNLSPMHSPFHLHKFTMNSFKALESDLDFEVVKYRYDVCSIDFVPRFFHQFLRWYMNKTNKGMQLTVYLRKRS